MHWATDFLRVSAFVHLAPPLSSRAACRQIEHHIILNTAVYDPALNPESVKYEMSWISHPVQSCTVRATSCTLYSGAVGGLWDESSSSKRKGSKSGHCKMKVILINDVSKTEYYKFVLFQLKGLRWRSRNVLWKKQILQPVHPIRFLKAHLRQKNGWISHEKHHPWNVCEKSSHSAADETENSLVVLNHTYVIHCSEGQI